MTLRVVTRHAEREDYTTFMPMATDLPADLRDLPRILEAAEGFGELLRALQSNRGHRRCAWNSSAALVAATLALRSPQTALVVLAHPRDVDFWVEDLFSFSGLRSTVFPAWDALPTAETVLDEVAGRRLRILRQLDGDVPPGLIVATFQALLQPVPDREQLARQRRRIKSGANIDLEELTVWLVAQGFERMEAVELPGEFSRRGGIVDVFSPDAEQPFRLEFLGDEIESIRPFDVRTQAAWRSCKPSKSPRPGCTPVKVSIAVISPITCRPNRGRSWSNRPISKSKASTISNASLT